MKLIIMVPGSCEGCMYELHDGKQRVGCTRTAKEDVPACLEGYHYQATEAEYEDEEGLTCEGCDFYRCDHGCLAPQTDLPPSKRCWAVGKVWKK